jgi:hypothetical protein
VHGSSYPVNAHKLRTGQWQYFGGTSTHHSLPLDETASKYWVSRSRITNSFLKFRIFKSVQTKIFFQKSTKESSKQIVGLRPAPPPYGAAPLPPTRLVPDVCLRWCWITRTMHLALHRCKWHPPNDGEIALWSATNGMMPDFLFCLVVNPSLLRLLNTFILVSYWLQMNLNIKVTQILYHWFLLLDWFRFWETHFTTYQRFVADQSVISPSLGGYAL